jgi:hypothetical protein
MITGLSVFLLIMVLGRTKPNLPKGKREPIAVGTTINMTEKSQRFPIEGV